MKARSTPSSVLSERNLRSGGDSLSTMPITSFGEGSALIWSFSAMSIVLIIMGAIMNRLNMMARPFMTIAGGTCCTPRALRTSDVTTTIFT